MLSDWAVVRELQESTHSAVERSLAHILTPYFYANPPKEFELNLVYWHSASVSATFLALRCLWLKAPFLMPTVIGILQAMLGSGEQRLWRL